MKNNFFLKFILLGILTTLIIIAIKPNQKITLQSSNPISSTINNDIIPVAPNVIGVRDDGSGTGIPNQLLLFEFDKKENAFRYIGVSLNVQEYLHHPEKYGIPNKKSLE